MEQTKNKKLGNSIVTERGLTIIRELKDFHKDKDIANPLIESEEDYERIKKKLEKLEWYGKELEIEEKKSFDKAIENLAIGLIDENKEFFKEHYQFVENFSSDQRIAIYLGYILGCEKICEKMGNEFEKTEKILEKSIKDYRNRYVGVEFS